jgi:hypothetical protein
VRSADFRLLKGEQFKTTDKGVRRFCPTCGTQLTFEHADFPDEIDVTTASLDDPESVLPRDNTHEQPAQLSGARFVQGTGARPIIAPPYRLPCAR